MSEPNYPVLCWPHQGGFAQIYSETAEEKSPDVLIHKTGQSLSTHFCVALDDPRILERGIVFDDFGRPTIRPGGDIYAKRVALELFLGYVSQ